MAARYITSAISGRQSHLRIFDTKKQRYLQGTYLRAVAEAMVRRKNAEEGKKGTS